MDKTQLITTPSRYFKSPKALFESDVIADGDKVTALKNWKDYIIHQTEGSYEGFEGVSPKDNLEEINNYLGKLKN